MTWSKAVRIQRLELLDEALELALRATCNGPFEVSGEMRDDMLACVFPRESGSTKNDKFVRTRRHDVVFLYTWTRMYREELSDS
jgi:hypothetical protein